MDMTRSTNSQRPANARPDAPTAARHHATTDAIPIIPLRRRKTQLACNECRRRQVKCEQLPPGSPCSRCKKRGIKCEYLSSAARSAPPGDAPGDDGRPSQTIRADQGASEDMPYSPSSPTVPSHPGSRQHWDTTGPEWTRNTEPLLTNAPQYGTSYYTPAPHSPVPYGYEFSAPAGPYEPPDAYGHHAVHPVASAGGPYVVAQGGVSPHAITHQPNSVGYPHSPYVSQSQAYHVDISRSHNSRPSYTPPSPGNYSDFQPNTGSVYQSHPGTERTDTMSFVSQGQFFDPVTRQWQS